MRSVLRSLFRDLLPESAFEAGMTESCDFNIEQYAADSNVRACPPQKQQDARAMELGGLAMCRRTAARREACVSSMRCAANHDNAVPPAAQNRPDSPRLSSRLSPSASART